MMKSSACSCMFMILTIFLIPISEADEIPLGSTLSASNPNSKWSSSPNKTFTFTFIPGTKLGPRATSPSAYYAAILYDDNVPIWVASSSGGVPLPADSTATLNLATNGNLVLRNGTTSSVVWQYISVIGSVQFATLDESGNFILKNSSNSSTWSTFDNPTDTLVPTQNFTQYQTLRSGDYSFRILNNGNLTLIWGNIIRYSNSGFNSSINLTSHSLVISMMSIGALSAYDPSLLLDKQMVFSSDYAEAGDILRFLRLDNDGNLRIYSSKRGSGFINARWSAVGDQCEVFGYCGNYGICSYSKTGPVCKCASENFEFVDKNDRRKGCMRKVDLRNCLANAITVQLDHTVFLTYYPEDDPETQYSDTFSIGISACSLNCLATSSCVASTAVGDGSGSCYLKVSEEINFVSAYQSPRLASTSFMKICGPLNLSHESEDKVSRRSKLQSVGLIVLVTVLVLIVLQGGLWCWYLRGRSNFSALSSKYTLNEYGSGAPVQFSYKELQTATKGFKEKENLGAKGSGSVYRGVLADRRVVAIKQLAGIKQGEKQFKMEIATISSTHHVNLVRTIGFCSEGRKRLIVYEFIKNGSLDKHLFPGEKAGKLLSWKERYNIALGVARGVTYLHEECRDCILHCDLKPENILLDEHYNAKVSDFGLGKLLHPNCLSNAAVLTNARGGYSAPNEWSLRRTSKSDVYSFGMILLEMVSGRRNLDVVSETSETKVSVWASEEFANGNMLAIIDTRLYLNEIDMEQVRRAIQVCFLCIQEQPSQRPIMSKVVQMLEGISKIEKPLPAARAMKKGSSGRIRRHSNRAIEGSVTSAYGKPFFNTKAITLKSR
ncbi:hypothetical protein Leryth_011794 [Lithospermum erythrorhizon]|nr:hypothetical protein Leryth_011794 [Lithospermum erythrorhizon]